MLFANQVVFLVSALAATAFANPVPESGIVPRNVVDLEWAIQPFADREEYVNVTGTVEQVIAEVSKINPNFEKEVLAAGQSKFDEGLAEHQQLSKRWSHLSSYCGGPWNSCSSFRIYQGVLYLLGLSGQPGMGPGFGTCARVSCSYNSAIWWCNDNLVSWTLSGWSDIAWPAYYIEENCVDSTGEWTKGQYFTTDNWNVIVRGDSC